MAGAEPPSRAEEVAAFLAGTFDSAAQSASDPESFRAVRLVAVRVPASRLGAGLPVLYVEQALLENPDRPYRRLLVTSSAEKADTLAKKLKRDGFRPDVSLVPGKKGLFRVRVGSYPDRARAEAAAKKVQAVEKLGTRPIVVPGGR